MDADEKIIKEVPILVIKEENFPNKRPEGVAFSSTGKYLAVANSHASSIEIFLRSDGRTGLYETKPAFVLSGLDSEVDYPHDVSFSWGNQHLAVADRSQHSVLLFKEDLENGFFEERPFHKITSARDCFNGVGAVAYSPSERLLAIADTMNHTVLIYRYKGEKYGAEPCCTLVLPNLQCPDGLVFSPDGQYLAVTYHSSNAVAIFKRSYLDGTPHSFHSEPVQVIQGEEALLNCPHSVAFHPSNDVIIISCAGGRNSVNVYRKTETGFASSPNQTLRTYNAETIHLQEEWPQEGGAKGIAISSDGKLIAVCNPDLGAEDKVYLFEFNP